MDKKLGQIFTPKAIVKKMINLISIDNPKILEPSSGKGAFFNELSKIYSNQKLIGIEIDENIAHKNAKIMDFFDVKGNFDVIIGNPPYVEFKDISPQILNNNTQLKHKPNLYMFFLEKCLELLNSNGEIIFIIPSEWLYSASFSNVLKIINNEYSIQYFKIIPENIWENASVTTAIVKIKKGNYHKKIPYYFSKNNKIIMGKKPRVKSNNLITIKVGAASGNNKKFKNKKGRDFFVDSKTERTGLMAKYHYSSCKEKWVRKLPSPPEFSYQIFVNGKTRKEKPFWTLNQKKGELIKYDASVLSIFVLGNKKDTINIMNQLNKLNWKQMGIKRNGRFHFTQSILEGVING